MAAELTEELSHRPLRYVEPHRAGQGQHAQTSARPAKPTAARSLPSTVSSPCGSATAGRSVPAFAPDCRTSAAGVPLEPLAGAGIGGRDALHRGSVRAADVGAPPREAHWAAAEDAAVQGAEGAPVREPVVSQAEHRALADLVADGLAGKAQVAGHLAARVRVGEPGPRHQEGHAPLEGPALTGLEGGVRRDGEVKVGADVQHHSAGADQLVGEHAEAELRPLVAAELVHEGLRVECPALGEARVLLPGAREDDAVGRNEVMLDQTNHPNAMRFGGAVLVCSTAHEVAEGRAGAVMPVLPDGSDTWRHYAVGVEGMSSADALPVEASPVALEDGRVRLYYGTILSGEWAIHAAVSDNGVQFTYEGEALPSNGKLGHDGGYVDSTVAKVGDRWHMFVYDSGTRETVHASSSDGVSFEIDSTQALTSDGDPSSLSSLLVLEDGFRVFSTDANGSIGSYSTTDGKTLTIEAGKRLTASEGEREGDWVKHASVVPNVDGGWMMVYMAEIPE